MLFLDCDTNLLLIVKIVKTIVWYITILVPIILVVIGTFDLLKAVTAAKDDEIKAAQKLLIKRIIYAILIFLIVPILNLIFGLFDRAGVAGQTDYDTNEHTNWNAYWNYKNSSSDCYGL